jgi:glycosyltransferase involved in cell wall biosynthesis
MQFGVPESRIHVIHNEVNAQEFCRQRFDRGTIRAALGLDDDVKMILMVARLTSYKRHDLMIEALPMIRAAVPSARVFALGEAFGEEEHVQGLRDKIKQSGQDEVFRLFPFQKDITQYYAAADAFVLCSDKEPLGRSIIEALAMETPVVVTDSGGPGEIIIDNETGMIARSGDARSLAKCLIRTLVDVPGCVTRTRAGRAFVEAHLSARSTAEKMMQIYELLMS